MTRPLVEKSTFCSDGTQLANLQRRDFTCQPAEQSAQSAQVAIPLEDRHFLTVFSLFFILLWLRGFNVPNMLQPLSLLLCNSVKLKIHFQKKEFYHAPV